LNNRLATYFAEPGFVGTDTFTFAAWDGSVDSNLGTGTVAVAQGPFSVVASAQVPPSYPADWPVPFGVMATASNVNAAVICDWDFGDGSPHGSNAHITHSYPASGDYHWTVVSSAQAGAANMSATNSGVITITAPATVSVSSAGNSLNLTWPSASANVLLEQSPTLGPDAVWTPSPVAPGGAGGNVILPLPSSGAMMFYRLRQL